ncbi:MAG: amidohydrolase family protein [Planctomycetaceae bacterium]|nr:amidohydrolase family protein [Planctomycetaceae bacterium]
MKTAAKHLTMKNFSLLSLFGALTAMAATPLWSAAPQEDEAADAAPTEVDTDADKYVAVIGGDIHTGTGAVLRGATMLVRNGKIRRIGHDIYIPEAAKVVHAHGYSIYPGMVALSASSRITDGTLSADVDDVESGIAAAEMGDGADADVTVEDWVEDWDQDFETTQAFDEAALRASDSYDPFSSFMVLTLAAGITSVESSNLPLKLRRDKLDDVVMGDGGAVNFNWGSPDARRSTAEDFKKAAAYLREYRAWEAAGDKEAKEPSRRGINSGAIKVLRGEGRAKFSADVAHDLLGIARLAQTYGFRPIIDGCREGWIVADELGRAGVSAIVQPRERRPKPDELMVGPAGSSIENAAILHKSGVQVAVKAMNGNVDLSGIAGRDLLALSIDAGFAVRGGLSEAAALQAVTIVPARILGVDHLVGSLEVGKDADFVITDGDLLHYETHVQLAFVLGEVAYEKNEELYYAHIRPRPKILITDGLKPAETAKDGDEATPPVEEPAPGDDPAPEDTPKPEDEPKPGDDPKPEDEPKPEVPPAQAA